MDPSPDAPAGQWGKRLHRLAARLRGLVPFASGVLASLIALFLYSLFAPQPQPLTAREVQNTVAQALASSTPPPAFSSLVYQVIRPSLVLIQTQDQGDEGDQNGGLGSGVVINDGGDILTCLHVVTGSVKIEVTFFDGTTSTAQVLDTQPENDIAVLSVDRPPLHIYPAVLGNPGAMHIGDEAYAVGNPFGLYGSMSAGVISGFNRSFHPPTREKRLEGLIQIDAAVNPGNSGGPLLNRYGQVVGIVVGIVNPTEQDVFIGIGFAVPINVAGGAAGLPPY